MTPKWKRLEEFYRRLDAADPASSKQEAYELVCRTLNEVEDELTQIPYDPPKWRTDGRLYPPHEEDSKRSVPERPDLTRYRSEGHNTFVSDDGAIRIDTLEGACVYSKPGSNGQVIE